MHTFPKLWRKLRGSLKLNPGILSHEGHLEDLKYFKRQGAVSEA